MVKSRGSERPEEPDVQQLPPRQTRFRSSFNLPQHVNGALKTEPSSDDEQDSSSNINNSNPRNRRNTRTSPKRNVKKPLRFRHDDYEGQKRKKESSIFHRPPQGKERYPPSPIKGKRKSVIVVNPGSSAKPMDSEVMKIRTAAHGSSSTSSSDDSGSDDEKKFQRRQAKSMVKARGRCMPMNMTAEDLAKGPLRDRLRISSSLADIDPMSIDRSVTFDSVGGLNRHLRSLKEMIVFPLLYPEVFHRFKITPPRGVLFHGPPGTGKTLVARALANECSQGDKRVAFFMRKGADCLSKWVGESERQLRLLFDQAYQMRPSIIFFDEIDGLAPVRSSRQDQIHSSIVSTLLALMDGLDSRGEIVVIGATNRIDAIDPALRRPGRFDREFPFALPPMAARHQILQIHTKDWRPAIASGFLQELAKKCVGYCGADLKALCTEAALHALRRRYPQIYQTHNKLQIDVSSILISARDFARAMKQIVPAAQRAVTSPAKELSPIVRPLLQRMLDMVMERLEDAFPHKALGGNHAQPGSSTIPLDDVLSETDDEGPSISHDLKATSFGYMAFDSHAYRKPTTHRPRVLICGEQGQAQTTHLGPAILHRLEGLPVFTLDLPALFAVSAKSPEESCSQVFREALRTPPSVLYMPHVGHWWDSIGEACRNTFLTLLHDMSPTVPVLILATSNTPISRLPPQIRQVFDSSEILHSTNPSDAERREFLSDLIMNQAAKPPAPKKKKGALQKPSVPQYYFTQPISHRSLDSLQVNPAGLEVVPPTSPLRPRPVPLPEGERVTHKGRRYRRVVRREVVRRKPQLSKSPFCRTTKRSYRNRVYYIDEVTGAQLTEHELFQDPKSSPEAPDSAKASVKSCPSAGRQTRNSRKVDSGDEADTECDEPAKPKTQPRLVVDHDRLRRLLDNCVKSTKNFQVERLERLYSSLSQCIYNHRRDFDKTALIKDMEQCLKQL